MIAMNQKQKLSHIRNNKRKISIEETGDRKENCEPARKKQILNDENSKRLNEKGGALSMKTTNILNKESIDRSSDGLISSGDRGPDVDMLPNLTSQVWSLKITTLVCLYPLDD
ncbi:hypothetical protein LIER_06995 [Lithospermum erythrorhizon]|uniref:Uncharacterized protein n=1 Tax=Lithospermum erythrorhizon TaxID=34254 RepID=A0AAV3P6F0_LITER